MVRNSNNLQSRSSKRSAGPDPNIPIPVRTSCLKRVDFLTFASLQVQTPLPTTKFASVRQESLPYNWFSSYYWIHPSANVPWSLIHQPSHLSRTCTHIRCRDILVWAKYVPINAKGISKPSIARFSFWHSRGLPPHPLYLLQKGISKQHTSMSNPSAKSRLHRLHVWWQIGFPLSLG